jgi:Mn2+/Fe2+ NRAMP family transporter
MLQKPKNLLNGARALLVGGPALVAAATGIGVGDLVTTAIAGSKIGLVAIWAVIVGVILKYVLNEGVARWQLATGTTLVEGIQNKLGNPFRYALLVYMVIWSFYAGGALLSACGLAAHAIAPFLSTRAWGIIHGVLCVGIILGGTFKVFENVMKCFVGFMVALFLLCVICLIPSKAAMPEVPVNITGNFRFLLALLGGVGGSVTMVSYGYWIREHKWMDESRMGRVRADLLVTYLVTTLVCVCSVILASKTLLGSGEKLHGMEAGIQLAQQLQTFLGDWGFYAYAVGFWGAATSSLLGTLQSVPHLFTNLLGTKKGNGYRPFVIYVGLVPLALLFVKEPITVILFFAAVASLFVPILATVLLIMNSRTKWVGQELRNSLFVNSLLLFSIGLFGYLFFSSARDLVNVIYFPAN